MTGKIKTSVVLFCLAAVFAVTSHAQGAESAHYKKRFGLRLELGAMPYVGINLSGLTGGTASAGGLVSDTGIGLPVVLEGTYSVTNAFEVLLGFGYTPTVAQLSGTQGYAMVGDAHLGMRYYFNEADPLKYYWALRARLSFTQVNVQPEVDQGLQWDITNSIGMLFQLGFHPTVFSYSVPGEIQMGVSGSLGVHYRF